MPFRSGLIASGGSTRYSGAVNVGTTTVHPSASSASTTVAAPPSTRPNELSDE